MDAFNYIQTINKILMHLQHQHWNQLSFTIYFLKTLNYTFFVTFVHDHLRHYILDFFVEQLNIRGDHISSGIDRFHYVVIT